MIKKQVKCPRCGRTLLRLYSPKVHSVKCTCGYITYFERHKETQTVEPKKGDK